MLFSVIFENGEQKTLQALSIWQPWAWLICHPEVLIECGIPPKTLENRRWCKPAHKGPFLIHAGQTIDKDLFHKGRLEEDYWEYKFGDAGLKLHQAMPQFARDYDRGAFIGQANLMSVVTRSNDPWFTGPYAFVLERARAFKEPVFGRGELKFFEVDRKLVPEFGEDA